METDQPDSQNSFRKRSMAIAKVACFVLVVIGLRGFVIATILDGTYRLSSFVWDAAATLIIFAMLQLADSGIKHLLHRVFGDKTKSRKVISAICRLAVVVLVFGTFLLATVQMHPPKIGCKKDPSDFGMEFTQHQITTSDGLKLSAWSIPSLFPDKPVVVVTHGLGANKQNFVFVSELFHKLNFNVVAFDFRGHGESEGHTCTLGVREAEDVKAAYELAKQQFPNRPVYAWSTSLGAAATLRASAEYGIFEKLIIDATFSSVENLARETKFCYLGPLESLGWNISRAWYYAFVRTDIQDYSPESDIAKIDAPIFLIHGTADSVIPHTESDRLKEAAGENAKLWKVEGAGHSMSFHHKNYPQRVLGFYKDEN